MKKNIIITISRGTTARNILQNDFFSNLKKEFDNIFILTPAYDDERFKKTFGSEKVIFLPYIKFFNSRLINMLTNFYRLLVFNINTKRFLLYYSKDNERTKAEFIFKYVKYFLLRIIFIPINFLKLRKLVYFFEYNFFQKKEIQLCREIIQQYKPSIILSTSMMEEGESILLKAAKKEGIPTVAMPKTWDNPSKMYFRGRADKIAVWGSFMKEQMIKMHDYKPRDIEIIGIPQFDYYINKSKILKRSEFCQKLGLDPEKKIIFFGSEGKLFPSDGNIVKDIYDLIIDNDLKKQSQILVRPHFAYKDDKKKFDKYAKNGLLAVDSFNDPSKCFRDSWDYSTEQMDHFLNSIYHSDIIINTCSTLTLDASALLKPVILIAYDGTEEKKPFYRSIARWYQCDYYQEILKTGGVKIVFSKKELKSAINSFLENPSSLIEEQKKLNKILSYNIDGKSGERLYNLVKKTYHNKFVEKNE
jgi:hypothetical protein